MQGIGALILIFGYFWLAIFVVRLFTKGKSRIWGIVAACTMVFLPFSDALIGRVILQRMCSAEGEITIKEKFTEVEGIASGDYVSPDSAKYYGYMWVESTPSIGWVNRSVSDGRGPGHIVERARPLAKYELHERHAEPSFYFRKTHYAVRTTHYSSTTKDDSRELSSFNWFAFRGGWAERVGMMISDAGHGNVAQCSGKYTKHEKIREMLHLTVEPLMFPKEFQPTLKQ